MQEHDELEFDDFQEDEEKPSEEKASEEKEKEKDKPPANHYVNNKEFYQAMIEWKKEVLQARDSGEKDPPVTEYIGKCFLDIATHLSYRPNFINYPYREEMIGDGIENCLMYCSNFDPEKSKNPFSYFTQIIYFAFLRRIQKEKKQVYIKYKLIDSADIYGNINKELLTNGTVDEESSNPLADHLSLSKTDIEKFTPKKRGRKPKKKGPLEELGE
jgi:hypothetical protein